MERVIVRKSCMLSITWTTPVLRSQTEAFQKDFSHHEFHYSPCGFPALTCLSMSSLLRKVLFIHKLTLHWAIVHNNQASGVQHPTGTLCVWTWTVSVSSQCPLGFSVRMLDQRVLCETIILVWPEIRIFKTHVRAGSKWILAMLGDHLNRLDCLDGCFWTSLVHICTALPLCWSAL